MSFSEALEKLKEGKKIKRKGWNGKEQYLTLAKRVYYKDIGDETHISNKAIVFHGTQGIQVGWLASQADMLTDDWEVIE